MDEAGVQYVGLVYITPLPIWNNGKPLVRQREAEHHRAAVAAAQAQQRAVAQVRAAVARWNGATDLVNDSSGLSQELAKEVAGLERLFELRQTDLIRLMQARQRLIQLDNSRLDAVWAATQAQADLLLALGTPALIHGMLNQARAGRHPRAGPRRHPGADDAVPFPFRVVVARRLIDGPARRRAGRSGRQPVGPRAPLKTGCIPILESSIGETGNRSGFDRPSSAALRASPDPSGVRPLAGRITVTRHPVHPSSPTPCAERGIISRFWRKNFLLEPAGLGARISGFSR